MTRRLTTALALVALALAVPAQAYAACCSCADKAPAQSKESWDKTIDKFKEMLEDELVAPAGSGPEDWASHQEAVANVWWDEHFLTALQGLAGEMTAAAAASEAQRIKVAEAAFEAEKQQWKVSELARLEVENRPSTFVITALENMPNPQVVLDDKGNATILSEMTLQLPYNVDLMETGVDPVDAVMAWANGEVKNCDPANDATLTEDCKKAQLALALFSPSTRINTDLNLTKKQWETHGPKAMRSYIPIRARAARVDRLMAGAATGKASKECRDLIDALGSNLPGLVGDAKPEAANATLAAIRTRCIAMVAHTNAEAQEALLRTLLTGQIESDGSVPMGGVPTMHMYGQVPMPQSIELRDLASLEEAE